MVEILMGIISGIVSGLGMGGGTILILLLTTFYNVDQHIAQSTNLVFFVPMSISIILLNMKQNNINFKLGNSIIIYGIIGAIIGAKISIKMNVIYLKKYFGIFLGLIAIFEIYNIIRKYIRNKKSHNSSK